MNDELRRFIKESLERGQDRESIRAVLLEAGWPERDLRSALAAFADVDFPVAVPRPRPYLYAREAFLYLVSFIALYVTAFSFGALVFGLIDRTFPDSLDYAGSYPSQAQATAIASVIVAFPFYLFLMRRLASEVAADPERRQSLVRRWLTYLTLVVGSGIILGDLIVLLASLLTGDPTLRFILKGIIILVITSVILGYYLWDMRQAEGKVADERAAPVLRVLVAGIVVIVVAGVGYGIFLMGSPGQQRDLRLDERRIDDLSSLSSNIDTYWKINGELPPSLAEMTGPRYFVRSIEDPETGAPYEYRFTGAGAGEEAKYELCAVFATDSAERREPNRPFSESAWDHGAGRTCFALEAKANPNADP